MVGRALGFELGWALGFELGMPLGGKEWYSLGVSDGIVETVGPVE